VLLTTAAVTAGCSGAVQGHIWFGLSLALGGALYVMLTSMCRTLAEPDSRHQTAVTSADMLLITAVVWLTGGVRSEYYLLYYLPVLHAGMRLSVRDGITGAMLAGVLYTFVAVANWSGETLVVLAPLRVVAVSVSAVVLVLFFTILGQQLGLAQNLRQALHVHIGRMSAVYNVAHAANRGADLQAVLSILVEHAARATRASAGAIALVQPNGHLKTMVVLGGAEPTPHNSIDPESEAAWRALKEAAPVVVAAPEGGAGTAEGSGAVSVYAPLVAVGGAIGVLRLTAEGARGFSRTHLEFLGSLCSEAAMAIENAQLRAELERVAVTDFLTGLANRREVERRLELELARAARHGRSLCLVAMDIDDLKAVNDRLGHAAGDEVLRAFARVLSTHIRASDVSGRVGGDEFMVGLPEVTIEQAEAVADRLIGAFARELLRLEQVPQAASLCGVSAGIAQTQGGESLRELIARADRALYLAKTQGKNRARWAAEATMPMFPALEPAVGEAAQVR